jgi:hypothetical protein
MMIDHGSAATCSLRGRPMQTRLAPRRDTLTMTATSPSPATVSAYTTIAALITLAAGLALREQPAAERDAFVEGADESDESAADRAVTGPASRTTSDA